MEKRLEEISTLPPEGFDKEATKAKIKDMAEELDELQNKLYASSEYAILIVLQGLDASGKDGAIKKVFRYVNPQGVNVKSFKKPSEIELNHDFLWRIHKETPEKGMIKIFNRSHYEDVLVTRQLGLVSDELAEKRFEIIIEENLVLSKTKILKFYLHISEEEQMERFRERMEDPRKHWKYNPDDLKTANHWPAYRKYYQEVFNKCSEAAPWHIVPSDKNWYKVYYILHELLEMMRSLDLKYPKLEH